MGRERKMEKQGSDPISFAVSEASNVLVGIIGNFSHVRVIDKARKRHVFALF